MPVTLDQVLDKVAAADEAADRERLRRNLLTAIAAMGHDVDRNGYVYNPAEGAYRSPAPRVVPRDQRFSARGGRRLR